MDTAVSRELGSLLRSREDGVRSRWLEAAAGHLAGRVSRAELEREQKEIFAALIAGLDEGATSLDDDAYEGLRRLLAEMSHTRARQGFTPSETAVGVFALRQGIFGVLDGEAGMDRITGISALVDDLGLLTFEIYASARDSIITEQAEQLLELSTPVVKLWEGVVAVPLVGTLDSARTQVVMEKLLQALVDTGSEHAIIDITGVPAVDTQVAQHLLKTIMAARLMGAECIISGIRPQIAQTIVALGIEFGDIRTKATLADALVAALRGSRSAATRPTEG